MRNRQTDPITIAIKKNTIRAQDWALSELACRLYEWIDIFNAELFKDQPVQVPVISFEKTCVKNLGRYKSGRNAFGVKETINLNRVHLNRPFADILATLLHEMTHSWQVAFGKPSNSWFHNKEFQARLKHFGICCNNKGGHISVDDPFVSLLKRHGISFDQKADSKEMIEVALSPNGRSKLKKWQCPCGQKARVGKTEFHATCDLCGESFELAI